MTAYDAGDPTVWYIAAPAGLVVAIGTGLGWYFRYKRGKP